MTRPRSGSCGSAESRGTSAKNEILLSPPELTGDEFDYVQRALETGWLAPLGPDVDAFEAELGEWVAGRRTLAVASGTAALHLALRVIGVGKGDVVLCSTFTFVASATPIVFQGATPCFVDSVASSWNLDPELLERGLVERAKRGGIRPKAIVVTDLFGQCADFDAINRIAREHGIPVIEDAAEALGATYKGRPAGALSPIGIFSFNGNKILTTGGGGALVCEDPQLLDRARFLSSQAKEDAPHFEHCTIGYNYRLSNLLAAIGRAQLKSLRARIESRRQIASTYAAGLQDLDGIELMPEASYGRCTRWLTCITIDRERFGAGREYVRQRLCEDGIESRPVWKPMHLQPVFSECESWGGSVSGRIFENGLCLPSGGGLSGSDQERIVDIIRGCAGREPH